MIITLSRRDLAQRALTRSIEVRRAAKVKVNVAIDPFDLCERLGVKVQFVDVGMEGFYRRGRTPRILLSALRPLVRRIYNCGHELGASGGPSHGAAGGPSRRRRNSCT